MRIDIQSVGIELTEPLREYIEDKIGGVEKLLGDLYDSSVYARVEVGRLTQHHRHGAVYHAQATLHIPGNTLNADHDGEDVRVAVDKVKQILQREIRKYKTSHF